MNEAGTDTDVVVVGGGLAGLTAAALLARRGQSVVLLERSEELGGRARTTVEDGYHLNLGPHALYRTGAGRRVLDDLDAWPAGGTPELAGTLGLLDEALHPLPVSATSLLKSGLLGLSGKIGFARAMRKVEKADPGKLRQTDVESWIRNLTGNADVRRLLQAMVRLNTYAHDTGLSADAAVTKMQQGFEGVLYPHGGWQSLVDALAVEAEQLGVEIRTGCRVDAVMVEERRVQGVRFTSGVGPDEESRSQTLSSPGVCLAVPIERAAEVAGEHAPGLETAARLAVPTRAATLDLGLRRLPRPERLFVLGIDRPLYFAVHSKTADLAPDDAVMAHATRYLGPQEKPDPDAHRAELEEFLSLVQPGWEDEVEVSRFLPAMTVSSTTPRGNRGGLEGRPRVKVQGVEGLALAGEWVGSEDLLSDCAFASARKAAEILAGG